MIADLQGAPLLRWVFTAYFLSATATVAVAGKLADLFGRRGVCMLSIGSLSRTGHARRTCRAGAVLQMIGLAMLFYVPPTIAELWVLLSFAVVGMGTGFAIPAMMTAFQNAAPPGRLGAAIGLASLFRQFGSSVGTTIVGADGDVPAKGQMWHPIAADH